MNEEQLSPLGRTALQLVRWGFAVFPCKPNGKQPNVKRGCNDWTRDETDITAHWERHPHDNIGITCGSPSGGLLVLDFDVDEERGKDGLATLREWEASHGELPETCVAITGSGGKHYLYMTDRNTIRPSVNAELGVDVRCDGSYIVAPGSIHPNGEPYEWSVSPDDCEVAQADGNVYDFLDHIQRNGGEEEGAKPRKRFALPEKIKKGERDDTLFRYAASLRSRGRSDEEIKMAVAGANATRCKPPMDSSDIERICRQAAKLDTMEGLGDPNGPMPQVPRGGGSGIVFRDKNKNIIHNLLGKKIIEECHARIIDGAPAVWTGKRWDLGDDAIKRCVLNLADDAKKQIVSEVTEYVKLKAPHVSSDGEFDGRYYVQFADCTYDVMAGEKVEPQPSMFITNTLATNLNISDRPNVADKFLEDISNGDEPTYEAMIEFMGSCLCSKRILNQSPMLIGTAGGATGRASNGKSTLMNWVRAIGGPENFSSLDIATLGQRFQAGRALGKLANLGDDIPDGFLKGDELSMFKKLVTGDSIYTDVKGGAGYEFRPNATMAFSMNSMPRLSDTTDGIFRRLYFIPFRRRFAEGEPGYDPHIAEKLATQEARERGALLALQGLRELIMRGGALPEIPDMVAEVKEVRRTNDSVLRWVYDNDVTVAGLLNRKPIDVYEKDFCSWAETAGERMRPSYATWRKKVLELMRPGTTLDYDFEGKRLAVEPRNLPPNGESVRVFVLKTLET